MHAIRDQMFSISSLLLGMAMLQMGASLQGTLIGVRAISEGFSADDIGYMSAGYFAGFIAGTMATAYMIERAGHIRAFTALASLASAGVLGHIIIIDGIAWTVFRASLGFSFAGIYVTMESWLNERATNETRGQVLALYMFVNLTALTVGQGMLSLADPDGYVLFCTVSILVSLSLIPVAMTRTIAPVPQKPRPLPLRKMFSISPLGVTSSFAFGMAMGSFWGLAPVFADRVIGNNNEIALFMALCILGGGALQWPMGWLSDHFDRRTVLTLVAFAGAVSAYAIAKFGVHHLEWMLYFAALFGATTFPLYAIAVSHTNDYVGADERVLVSGTLLMVYGSGAILGPIFGGLAMQHMGSAGLFHYMSSVFALVGCYGLWRMTRRAAVPREEQGKFVPSAGTMHPGVHMDGAADQETETPATPSAEK